MKYDFEKDLRAQVRKQVEAIIIEYANLDDQKMIDELVELVVNAY